MKNKEEILELIRKVSEFYETGEVLAIFGDKFSPEVQVSLESMESWAPLKDWNLNLRDEDLPGRYRHILCEDEITIFAVSANLLVPKDVEQYSVGIYREIDGWTIAVYRDRVFIAEKEGYASPQEALAGVQEYLLA